jgi:Ricin-type beta-trefoil lectin domain-like
MRYGSRHSVLAPKSSLEERGMRLATACSRRIAEGLSRYWHRAGRLGRLAAVGLALCLAVLCATAAGISLLPASADSSAPAALAVPGGMLAAVKSAALSCPELSPPRLVNSGSGRCLDTTGKSSADGTPLQVWDFAGTSNQLWELA